MQADRGAEQLDRLAGKLVQFPNVIGGEIDLTGYMEDDVSHRVKSADAYRDAMINLVLGDDPSQKGTALPWNRLHGNFELRQHEMTVWSGYKGHGKSAIISQAFVSLMKRGQRVFIISPEFRPERVLERMLYQYTVTRLVTADDIGAFITQAARQVWLYDNQASLKPKEVIALCRYAAKELQVDHILIDSLMKCGIGPDDLNGQKAFTDRIQSVCHTYPLHMHLVAHARKANNDESPPKLHDIKGTSEIVDMAENVICVWRNKPKEKDREKHSTEPDAVIIVEAQRNAEGWIGPVNLFYDTQTMLFYEPGYSPERADRVRF